MKFFETHFDEYLQSALHQNLHPKLTKGYFARFPKKVPSLCNLILFGPVGVGKYTQMLVAIQRYSPTRLKYEKTLSVVFDKKQYLFKMSDIHYEIDMSLLGCNAKLLWNEIYHQIVDSVSAHPQRQGIIVCKNFQSIHSELLDIFYSYMQYNRYSVLTIRYLIITTQLSFLPDSIVHMCQVIPVDRPTPNTLRKCFPSSSSASASAENLANLKYLKSTGMGYSKEMSHPYQLMCDKIIHEMIHIETLSFVKFRDLLYDWLIYDLNLTDCVWYILTYLMEHNRLPARVLPQLLIKTYRFFHHYNNNYRPIYHLENYLLYVSTLLIQ